MSEQSNAVYFDQVDVGDEIGPLDKKPYAGAGESVLQGLRVGGEDPVHGP